MSAHGFIGGLSPDFALTNDAARYEFDGASVCLTGGILESACVPLSLQRARARLEPLERQRASMARLFGEGSNAVRCLDDITRSLLWSLEQAERAHERRKAG